MSGESSHLSLSHCSSGWLVSIAVHSLMLLSGVLLVQSVERTSFPKAFQWDVALVESGALPTSKPAAPVDAAPTEHSPPSPTASRTSNSSHSPAVEPRESVIEQQRPQPVSTEPPTLTPIPTTQSPAPQPEPVERTPTPPIQNHAVEQTVAASQTVEPSTAPTPARASTESPKQDAKASVPTPIPNSTVASSLAAEPVPPASPTSTSPVAAHKANQPAPQAESSSRQPESLPHQSPAVLEPPSEPARSVPSPEMGSDQDVPPGNEGRSSDAPTKVASLTPIEAPSPSSATISQGKPDFGWLSEIISKRVEELKRYPAMARADRLEGRVVIRAVVKDDGHLADIQIAKSSGHETLDRAAIEVLQQAFPVPMLRALGKPRVTIHVPLSYRLDR